MKRFLLAIQFLTILPIRVKGDVTEGDMLGSAVFFPVVGLMQGGVVLALGLLSAYLFPPELTAAIVVLLLVITNGGFHLDGLADTADGLACKGDAARRLEAMRDSATGPVGASAIVFTVLIKYAAIAGIIKAGVWPFALAVVFMPALSKWVMLIGMNIARPARNEGLGAIFIGKLPVSASVATGLLVLTLMVMTVMLAGWSCMPVWHVIAPFSLLTLIGFTNISDILLKRTLGGQSGDTLGALGELSELIYVLMVAGWSNHFIS